ncbi:MAG: prolipoprotein diacylglyceryl transferase [Nitrospirae bacterium]|nr:prolipoprotein diacylglyceryl transferase [Nitrospirota bacterium]
MIPYPRINPEIVGIGPLSVRWYGTMYLLGFLASYLLVRYQIKKRNLQAKDGKQESQIAIALVDSIYSYLIIGLLIGARFGYVLFYNLPFYIEHPLDVFAVWKGGMSFHGGLIGSLLAGFLFCRRFKLRFWEMSDLIIITAPVGIGLGRIGNFINGELYGRVSSAPWAMIFPDGGNQPRHPSQLYEFLLEGAALFIILWTLRNKGFRHGVITSLFMMLYGVFRFIVEFFREPDPQIGHILGLITMGQVLCLAMVISGSIIMYLATRKAGQ